MPAAHGDKGLRLHAVAAQRRFQRIGLLAGFLEDGRAAADMVIDLARHRRAPPRDQPRQRQAHNRGQGDDGGIGKQIAQERLDRFRRIRPAQVEQDDGELHPRMRFSNCSTWAMGVSGRMPWPRLKMMRPARHRFQNVVHRPVQRRAAGDQGDGIQIALHGAAQILRRPAPSARRYPATRHPRRSPADIDLIARPGSRRGESR